MRSFASFTNLRKAKHQELDRIVVKQENARKCGLQEAGRGKSGTRLSIFSSGDQNGQGRPLEFTCSFPVVFPASHTMQLH